MSLWGPLAPRFEKNDGRPRRLLALDGGGIRGILTLEILLEIQSQLRALLRRGDDFRLADFFDYIAGTSTGAIIAAGLARGKSVEELRDFYLDVGPQMFGKSALRVRWKHLYDSNPLATQLKRVFGEDATLAPRHLRCLLLVVARNATTDSPWPVSSNPLAKFNDLALADCNLNIPLWKLVRASTAAPVYFPPEVVDCDPGDDSKSFVFVDGGLTPYNNPALLLYRMATAGPYRLCWPDGEDRMMLVSIGTGAARTAGPTSEAPELNIASNLLTLPGAMRYAAQVDQDVTCRMIGRCIAGDPIDQETGDLIPRDDRGAPVPLDRGLGRKFVYARYSADFSEAGLAALGIDGVEAEAVYALDAVDHVDDLRRIGKAAAKRSVRMRDFGRLVTD